MKTRIVEKCMKSKENQFIIIFQNLQNYNRRYSRYSYKKERNGR